MAQMDRKPHLSSKRQLKIPVLIYPAMKQEGERLSLLAKPLSERSILLLQSGKVASMRMLGGRLRVDYGKRKNLTKLFISYTFLMALR